MYYLGHYYTPFDDDMDEDLDHACIDPEVTED